jgi:iron only hydrogenase large subunit-like protein
MACPSGCLNGGGQPKPPPGVTSAQLLDQLDAVYHHAEDVVPRHPQDNPAVQALYSTWVGGLPASDKAKDLLHTSYRKREGLAGAGGAGGAMASDW